MSRIIKTMLLILLWIFQTGSGVTADSDSKPVWRFSVIASVSEQTMAHYGGIEIVRELINEQFDSVNSRFNVPDVFDGEFLFAVDSIQTYTGHPLAQAKVSHPDYDYQIIYDAFSDKLMNWLGPPDNTVLISRPLEKYEGPFTDYTARAATHEFAHSRGAIDIYGLMVLAEYNPICDESYYPELSIMSYTNSDVWDKHTINIINMNENRILEQEDFPLDKYMPSCVRLIAVDMRDKPVPDVRIKLYPHTCYVWNLEDQPVFNDTTGTDGVSLLDAGLMCYLPAEPEYYDRYGIRYNLFLIEAVYENTTQYGWLPMTTIQNAYFDDPSKLCDYKIMMPFYLNAQGQPIPRTMTLEQNYPNPFNATTNIQVRLSDQSRIKLTVFNSLGQKEQVLYDGWLPWGLHTFPLSGDDLPSGVYYYQVESNGAKESKKMLLLK